MTRVLAAFAITLLACTAAPPPGTTINSESASAQVGSPHDSAWYVAATCRGPIMTLELYLDRDKVGGATVPLCRATRESAPAQGQESFNLEFSFRAPRRIDWQEYRAAHDWTPAGILLHVYIWQAGADSGDVLFGMQVADADSFYMNTLHVAIPDSTDTSETAPGFRLITHPDTAGAWRAPDPPAAPHRRLTTR